MIQTTDEFHEVANGQVRPLDWESAIAFQKSSSEPYEIEGSLSQPQTYRGVNLQIGSPSFEGYSNLNTWTAAGEYEGKPVIKKEGAWGGAYKEVQVKANTTYTFSVWVRTENANASMSIYLSGGTATVSPNSYSFAATPTWTRVHFSFNATAAGTIRPRVENWTNQTGNPTYICGYQLEAGTAMTEYEPYMEGAPSPNPFYPEPITTKTGDIIVNYDGHNYPISLGDIELAKIGNYEDVIKKGTGKNLYVASQDFSGEWNNSDRWLTQEETYSGLIVKRRWAAWQGISKDLQVERDKTYTFSCFIKGETGKRIVMYITGGTATFNIGYKEIGDLVSSEWQRLSMTFTVTSSGTIKPRIENGVEMTGIGTSICGYQLEEGSTMTDYEPYGKGWYIEKNIGKVTLNGSETYGSSTLSDGYKQFQQTSPNLGIKPSNTEQMVVADTARGIMFNDRNTAGVYTLYAYSGDTTLRFKWGSKTMDGNQFKAYLAENPMLVYYVKNVPTYEAITDENLLTQLNAPLQPRPDYMDVKNRTISISTSRSVEFPHTVQSATCDLELDNHDKKFSYSNHSELGPYILPNRPMAIELGFKEVGTVPHFYGNTIMPKYQGEFEEVATFTANDDLSKLGENHLPNMIMLRDVRTDEAIEAILVDLGVPSDKYELEEGANRIPFVYFDADKSVGNALKELVQAENGALWQDEKGIIRFAARNTNAFSQDPVMIFDKTNTIAVEPSHVDNIVNSVSITADIRKVESRQQIFTADNANGYQSEAAEDNYRVAANGSISIWLSLDDPTWTCSNPILNGSSDSSTFTAVDLSGNEVSSNVSATGTLFATSYKVDFINTNSFPVSINSISLWGEPAKLIGGQAVEYFATDDDSVSKFGTYKLDITENPCFGSVENMKRYALDILNKYADYNAVVKLRAKCDPALQLGDVVQLALPNYTGRYTIRGIETQLTADGLSTTLTLNLLVSGEVGPFILDQSQLDGADLLG